MTSLGQATAKRAKALRRKRASAKFGIARSRSLPPSMNLIWKISGSPEHVGAKWLGSLEHAEPVSPGRRHELHEGPIVVGPTEVPSAPMTDEVRCLRRQRFGGHRVLRQLSRVRLGTDAARQTTVNGSDGTPADGTDCMMPA